MQFRIFNELVSRHLNKLNKTCDLFIYNFISRLLKDYYKIVKYNYFNDVTIFNYLYNFCKNNGEAYTWSI